jgi:Domain of unknown function (DUF4372)/Transposase DDE domain
MNAGRTVFTQLMEFLPLSEFRRCVERYRGDYKVQHFSCLDQFLCLAFAQLTYRESLRDIEACLRAQGSKLYHMGFRGHVSRNNLAHANEHRDWRIFADFGQVLIGMARDLYRDQSLGIELAETVYAMDSTTIDLCLSLFPWAQFRRHKSAIKVHTLLEVGSAIPASVYVTGAQVADVLLLDQLLLEPGAFYLMDRGYYDFARLYLFTQACAYFITRAKHDIQFRMRSRRAVDLATGLRCDQTIRLTGPNSSRRYPALLRRIHYVDPEQQRDLVFLTNNFRLAPLTIAQLYRARWQVELFFRWIKQHLHIKSFYGTSANAVRIQVWVALSVYLLVAIAKKHLAPDASLYKILQVLSITIFEKTAILEAFSHAPDDALYTPPATQMTMFDL